MSRIISFKFTEDKSAEDKALALLILRPDLSLEKTRELVSSPECKECRHKKENPDGGHCYMFRERPARCAQWIPLKGERDENTNLG